MQPQQQQHSQQQANIACLCISLLLQVLLDVLSHEELSDFLALLVRQQGGRGSCSSKGYSAAAAAAAASLASRSGSGTLIGSQQRAASSISEWQMCLSCGPWGCRIGSLMLIVSCFAGICSSSSSSNGRMQERFMLLMQQLAVAPANTTAV
jgi:hypothetical protein